MRVPTAQTARPAAVILRLLAFVACLLVFATSSAAEPEFRAQVLVDLDANAQTGCPTEVGAPGGDLRFIALSDRHQIFETRIETCHDGDWQLDLRDQTPRPVAFGEGVLGSDSLRWSVPRSVLGYREQASLSFALERIEPSIIDQVQAADGTMSLALPGLPVMAIPTMGWGVSGLLVLGLMALAWRSVRSGAHRGLNIWFVPASALLLALTAVITSPAEVIAASDSQLSISIEDASNDVSDAAVDIVAVHARSDEAHVEFRFDVNNIEEDGLQSPARVLFIGNSLTSSNSMPAMLEAIARQAGKQLVADSIALPNYALVDHFDQRTAHTALASGQYQFVIMQQGPSSLLESRRILVGGARLFEPLIRAGGARPAMYMVWPDFSRIAYFDDVRESYSQAALAVNGMFIPAGQSWLTAWSLDVNLALYSTDNFHPSQTASYLAALSIFCELYRQSPIDLPPRLSIVGGQTLNLNPDVVRTLQTAAWMTHLQYGRAGG